MLKNPGKNCFAVRMELVKWILLGVGYFNGLGSKIGCFYSVNGQEIAILNYTAEPQTPNAQLWTRPHTCMINADWIREYLKTPQEKTGSQHALYNFPTRHLKGPEKGRKGGCNILAAPRLYRSSFLCLQQPPPMTWDPIPFRKLSQKWIRCRLGPFGIGLRAFGVLQCKLLKQLKCTWNWSDIKNWLLCLYRPANRSDQ